MGCDTVLLGLHCHNNIAEYFIPSETMWRFIVQILTVLPLKILHDFDGSVSRLVISNIFTLSTFIC